MVRKFFDEFDSELRRRRKVRPHLHGTLVTGRLFYPFLKTCIERFNGRFQSRLDVLQVTSRFMGKDITVAGLLAGGDIVAALEGSCPGDFVVIPDEAVSRADAIMVDDLSPADLARSIGKPVYPSGRTMRDFFALVCDKL